MGVSRLINGWKPNTDTSQEGDFNLGVFGCGPYARDVYLPLIYSLSKVLRTRISFVVELEDKIEDTKNYLARLGYNQTVVLTAAEFHERYANDQKQIIPSDIFPQNGISAGIVSTEPESHLDYALWLIENKIHTLIDKPITISKDAGINPTQAYKILEDYKRLADAYETAKKEKPQLACQISVQRRYDPQYTELLQKIENVQTQTGQAPSHIRVVKSDGQWRIAEELATIQYHGFDRGYGVLGHTGYHIFDMIDQIIRTSNSPIQIDSVQFFSTFVRANDLSAHPIKLSPRDASPEKTKVETPKGEIDAHVFMKFLSQGKIVTTAEASLIHNGLSARTGSLDQSDLYQGSGRFKHEEWQIFQGPYAFHTLVDSDMSGTLIKDWSASAYNPLLQKQGARTRKGIRTMIKGGRMNIVGELLKLFPQYENWKIDASRRDLLYNFLESCLDINTARSSLETHSGGVTLLTGAYLSAARQFENSTESPLVTLPYTTGKVET